jgi:hypothetical protein
LVFTITKLPASGTLFECDAHDAVVREVESDSLPCEVHSNRVRFQPEPNDQTTNTFEYKVTNSAGLDSSVATVSISV